MKKAKTIGELIAEEVLQTSLDLVNSGRIYNTKPSEFFKKMRGDAKQQIFDIIDEKSEIDFIYEENKEEVRKKIMWIREYMDYRLSLNLEGFPKTFSTTSQQLLIIYYLQKAETFKLNTLNQDASSKAKLLSVLFNRGYDNTYSHYKRILSTKYAKEYFTEANLQFVLNVFEEIKAEDICKKIRNDIKKFFPSK